MRIAAAQMNISPQIPQNVQHICNYIDQAAAAGAEILLTPEGSLSAYTHDFDRDECEDGLAVICDRAREKNIGLALGTCFVEDDNRCYNQIRFYRQDGTYLGF
ncbi:MAG: hypothetical protein HRU15_17785, partial [Planctomycetes bacterium]|nr:hypothetical protein [Planctomycetota bacterium]